MRMALMFGCMDLLFMPPAAHLTFWQPPLVKTAQLTEGVLLIGRGQFPDFPAKGALSEMHTFASRVKGQDIRTACAKILQHGSRVKHMTLVDTKPHFAQDQQSCRSEFRLLHRLDAHIYPMCTARKHGKVDLGDDAGSFAV